MDEKLFALFSNGLLILYEGICEQHNAEMIGAKARLAEDPEEQEASADLVS